MNDLISRQAAIDALDKRFDSIPMEQTTEILQLRKDLRELPSAERRGRWIELYKNNYKCSVCGSWWTCEETPIESGMSYCPNCGARMEATE